MKQVLTFRIDNETYGVDVVRVKEILEYIPITRIPRAPAFMVGVANVRGSVIPVMDIRLKFGMQPSEKTIDTGIIVIEVFYRGETVFLGIVTDSVKEVVGLSDDMIEKAPNIGLKMDNTFIQGIGKNKEEFIVILNFDAIMAEGMPAVSE